MENKLTDIKAQNMEGVTVSWEVNAHVIQIPSVIARIRNRHGNGPVLEKTQRQILKNGE